MCPWLVAAQAKARLGNVSVGTEANQWSQTAKPRARPDRMGRASGVNMPMMLAAVVPGATLRPTRWSQAIVASKLVTNPWLVATGGSGAVPLPNSWELVLA
jgi:hypothetical protein